MALGRELDQMAAGRGLLERSSSHAVAVAVAVVVARGKRNMRVE